MKCRLAVMMFVSVLTMFAMTTGPALAREAEPPTPKLADEVSRTERVSRSSVNKHQGRARSSSQGTTILGQWDFDGPPGVCDPMGWTSHDLTREQGLMFHVDDFLGLLPPYAPLTGSNSLWCGSRTDPEGTCTSCFPGYGNGWEECFESVVFPRTGDVTIEYNIRWDSEPGYDRTFVQYKNAGGVWTTIQQYDNAGGPILEAYAVSGVNLPPGECQFRIMFRSDGAFSDDDCLFPTDGAVVIDDLKITDSFGTIDFQDFEAESVGSNTTNDGNWSACTEAFGDYSALIETPPLQQDPCTDKRCVWIFNNGSPDQYECGLLGIPAVPKGNSTTGYISNEIRSPTIPYVGSGNSVLLEFCVYEDLPLDNLVFYNWRVRTSTNGSCWTPWCTDNFVYFGDSKRWVDRSFDISDCIPPGTQFIQVAIGVSDQCQAWCGLFGSGSCHTHAPMFDEVAVVRQDFQTTQHWEVSSDGLYQDNFSTTGLGIGVTRLDRAQNAATPPAIVPGDEVLITVRPDVVLDNDAVVTTRKAVYMHVKSSVGFSGGAMYDPSESPDFPYTGNSSNGFREFLCANSGGADEYMCDVRDDIFTSGTVIEYYFSAIEGGVRTYWSETTGPTPSEAAVQAAPIEVTCLPGPGALTHGGDILFVDDADGEDEQFWFDNAFQFLGITNQVDRYDVRAPGAGNGNGLGGRVQSAAAQLIPYYNVIIWASGAQTIRTVSDGNSDPGDDFSILYDYLWDNDEDGGGVFLVGDNLACDWATLGGVSATSFRSQFMSHSVLACCHRDLGIAFSPSVWGLDPPGIYLDSALPFEWVGNGGCPRLCCFDVIFPAGSAVMAAAYENNLAYGAILYQETINPWAETSKVILSGMSYGKNRDASPGAIPARIFVLGKTLQTLGTVVPIPVTADEPAISYQNTLGQNYPNPFNPTTQVAYSLADPGPISVTVFDATGRVVRTLIKTDQHAAGIHVVTWDGRDKRGNLVPTGVYFYRMTAAGFEETRKMVMVK